MADVVYLEKRPRPRSPNEPQSTDLLGLRSSIGTSSEEGYLAWEEGVPGSLSGRGIIEVSMPEDPLLSDTIVYQWGGYPSVAEVQFSHIERPNTVMKLQRASSTGYTLVAHVFPEGVQWSGEASSANQGSEEEDRAKFERLATQWRIETEFLSSPTEAAVKRSYQQIIGMGEKALPLIFSELNQYEPFWFWALQSITGEDPVQEQNRGLIREMCEDWLQWGRARGFKC